MLRRIGFRLVALTIAVLTAGDVARADILLLVQDTPAVRDLTLTIHGRQALSADPAFRDLTVLVQVKKGVAELRGQVPDEALSRKAAKIMEDVPGILGVRNYLEIRAVKKEPGILVLEPEAPSSARAASPGRLLFPEIPATIPTVPTEPRPAPTPTPIAKTPPPGVPPAVVLGPPMFTEEPGRRPTPPEVLVTRTRPNPLTQPEGTLAALLAEPNFKDMKVEQRGGTVFVHTAPGEGARTMALARRLRDLPGIEEIVLVPEGR
jgi:hypothetical protein